MFPCDWSPIEMMMWLRVLTGGGGGEETTVSGVSPLSLTNALAKNIVSLTQYGLCTQASTPTPSSPVDIKCNNGKLALVSEGVPTDYVRLEYLEADGTQYIDTGITISPQTKYVIKYTPTTGSWIAGYTSGAKGRWGLAYNSSDGAMTLYSDKTSCTMNIPAAYTEAVFDFGVGITYNGQTVNFPTTPTRSTGDFTAYLFEANGSSAASGAKINYFAIYEGNNLVQELIPCVRRSDGVLGMYDTVSETFYTNAGTGTFTAGNAIGEVCVVGTPEVLSVTATVGTPQTVSVANLLAVGDYKDEQDVISGLLTHKVGIKMFDGTEKWREATHKGVFFTSANMGTIETTSPILCNAFSYSSAANANMPNYTGKLANTSAFGGAFHFVYDEYTSDVDGFTAWLAAQYVAGTPVIVVYPLAQETTESVTGHTLHTAEGTNTVTVTAAVSPIQLSVVYKAESQ